MTIMRKSIYKLDKIISLYKIKKDLKNFDNKPVRITFSSMNNKLKK